MVTKYQKRISGPLLDRIDIHIEVPRVDYDKLSGDRVGRPAQQFARLCRQHVIYKISVSQRTVHQILFVTPICALGRSGNFASYRMKVSI